MAVRVDGVQREVTVEEESPWVICEPVRAQVKRFA
jgi:hypothetical protein